MAADEEEETMSLFEPVKPRRGVIIEPVLFLFYLYSSTLGVLGQEYVYERKAQEHNVTTATLRNSSEGYCKGENTSTPTHLLQETIQREAAIFNLIINIGTAVPGLFSTVFFGAYSDMAGRRVAIFFPNFGKALRIMFYLVTCYFKLSIWWLLPGAIFDGICGSNICEIAATFAYLADTTTKEDRTFRMTIMVAATGISVALGTVGLGFWIKESGFLEPFWGIAALAVMTNLYVLFFVPETLKRDPHSKFQLSEPLQRFVNVITADDSNGRRTKIAILIFLLIPYNMVEFSLITITTEYMLNSPLCFDSVRISYFLAMVAFCFPLGSIMTVFLFGRCLSDPWLCCFSATFFTLTCTWVAFSRTTLMLFLGKSCLVHLSINE